MSFRLPTEPEFYVLVHLLIGSLIRMVLDHGAFNDAFRREWVGQNGRLPSTATVVLAHARLIVTWPKTVWLLVAALVGRGR